MLFLRCSAETALPTRAAVQSPPRAWAGVKTALRATTTVRMHETFGSVASTPSATTCRSGWAGSARIAWRFATIDSDIANEIPINRDLADRQELETAQRRMTGSDVVDQMSRPVRGTPVDVAQCGQRATEQRMQARVTVGFGAARENRRAYRLIGL